MASNIETFTLDLRRYRQHIDGRVVEVHRAIALEAARGVVERTPVDTGRARGNWQLTIGEPATGYVHERLDKTGGQTIMRARSALQALRPYQSVWLHNGVPYINYLERGTDKMRPFHMVLGTVNRLRAMLRSGGPRNVA